jgi:predicted permease
MERLFAETRAAWEEGRGGEVAFWLAVTWDTVRGAAGEWASLLWMTWSGGTATRREPMSVFMSDVRYAWRQILRQPLYAGMILLLMTVGIAGNAAVFRVFNGLFLRPLPFPDAERLVDLDETAPEWDLEYVGIAYPDFVEWRRSNRTFTSMAVYTTGGANMAADGSAERISFVQATHDLDDVLGIEPLVGRFFTEAEDVPDGPKLALLTDGFWAERFARAEDILGRTISLNGEPYEIIGVLPPRARFVDEAQVWVPLQADPADHSEGWYLTGVGRLASDVTPEQARSDLQAVHRGMIPSRSVNGITSPVLSSLRDRYLGDNRLSTRFLLAAVGIVLLIACANIAGLMFARSLARQGEIAVRRALGAARSRLVAHILTESALLATLGATAGTALGVWGSGLLVEAMADQFPTWVTFDLDARFFGFSLAVTVGAVLLFGLIPAFRTSAGNGVGHGTRQTAGRRSQRGMGLLVAGEVALALILLVVGGLSSLDVWRLGRIDPGFRVEGVTRYSLALQNTRYPDNDARVAFAEAYLERLRATPGVERVALANVLPLSGHWGWFFRVENEPPRAEGESNPVVLNRVVTPGYLETMGVRRVAGRDFTDFDGREEGAGVVIVNETFARTRMGGVQEAVGRRIAPGTGDPDEDDWLTVVGVTRDVKHYGVDEEMRPGVYQPLKQVPLTSLQVAMVFTGSTQEATTMARRVTSDMDPELAVFRVGTMAEAMNQALWTRRATSWLIGLFSVVALLLAVAGLYGVISYSVGRRAREIGVRMAVGARHGQVLVQVVRGGMGLVVAGVVVGLLVTFASARLIGGILVDVSPTEPRVYAGVTVLVLVVATLANFVPARRAAHLDPVSVLRRE